MQTGFLSLLVVLAACAPAPDASADANRIPAEDPVVDALTTWPRDPAAYGLDASSLRERVAIHRATLAREQAREAVLSGDFTRCAASYRAGAETSAAAPAPVREALTRDAALCDQLAGSFPPPVAGTQTPDATTTSAGPASPANGTQEVGLTQRHRDTEVNEGTATTSSTIATPPPTAPTLASLWGRWVALHAGTGTVADAQTLATDAEALAARAVPPASTAGPDWSTWADAVDPLGASEPLGPWDPARPPSVAAAIAAAARAYAATPPTDVDARRASLLAPSHALARPAKAVVLDVALLAEVPSTDLLADLGALPLPRETRTLARMGVGDPSHRAYLEVQAKYLETVPAPDLPPEIADVVLRYDRMGHTSRWYNRAALRQGTARSLSSRGAWRQAARVLSAEDTLAGPGWTRVARNADLALLQARMLLAAGDARLAGDRLEDAASALDAYANAVAIP
jgi:hypothetical protein